MALPIVHGTAGYLIQRRSRVLGTGVWSVLAAVLIANLPDLDFVVGFLLGRPGMFHRGVSHTLAAALVFGIVAGGCYRLLAGSGWLRATVLFTLLYTSHLVVDAFTVDARPPYGAQFLWPLSDAYLLSPVTIFGEILVDGSARFPFLRTVFSWDAAGQLLREASLSIGALGVAYLVEQMRQARRRGSTSGALGEPAPRGETVGYDINEQLAYQEVEVTVVSSSPKVGAGQQEGGR